MGLTTFHRTKTHNKHHSKRAVDASACPTGGITNPKNGQTLDSLQPINITWNTACLEADRIDIYLTAPGAAQSRIFLWQGVPFDAGFYETELFPRWWNSTAAQALQITMVPLGVPTFMSELSAGPVFNATYTEPDSGVPDSADPSVHDQGWTSINTVAQQEKGMSPGKTAAAVLVPLIFLGLLGYAYIKYTRGRGKKERKRWSQAVDKRMSTISADWKSISAAGATAAIRNSIAVNGSSGNLTNRASSFSFGGGIRPVSTVGAVEGSDESDSRFTRPMSQMRTGVGLRNPVGTGVGYGASQERQSRVSFAEGTRTSRVSFADSGRPSLDSRKSTGTSRAFHTGFVPPMPDGAVSHIAAAAASTTSLSHKKNPTLTKSNVDGTDTPGIMSPRQTAGAFPLSVDDIKSKMAVKKINTTNLGRKSEDGDIHGGRDGYDDFMPALSMIRTTTTDSPIDSEFLFDVPPTPAPAPVHHKQPRSPSYPSLPRTASSGTGITNNSNDSSSNVSAFDSTYELDSSGNSTTSAAASHGTMSPVMSSMAMPAATMSPDDMLRAYAEKRKRGSITAASSPSTPTRSNSILGALTSGKKKKRTADKERLSKFGAISGPISAPISYPAPVAGTNAGVGATGANGMRILYEQDNEKNGDKDAAYRGAVGM